MAELLANVAIAGPGGLPQPYYLARWRTVARALPTWRPLPAIEPIHDLDGNPTAPYRELFDFVFGFDIDPKNVIAHPRTGLPTKQHRDDWAKIP